MFNRSVGLLLVLSLALGSGLSSAEPLPFLMPSDFQSLSRVAWRVEQGEQDEQNPLLEPEMPWEDRKSVV
jgi:hypothetical protein